MCMKIVKYLFIASIIVVITAVAITAHSYNGYIEVPNILNMAQSDAESLLIENNINYEIVYENSDEHIPNSVFSVSFYGYKGDENYYMHPDKVVQLKVSKGNKIAYLTFDDGPTKYNTYRVLEILEKYDIKATFFFIGNSIEYYTEQFKAAYDAGHVIGCHSTTHKFNEIYASATNFVDDIDTWESIAFSIIEKPDYKIYRYPGGSSTARNYRAFDEISASLDELGYIAFDWNMSNNDVWSKTRNGGLSYDEYVKSSFLNELHLYAANKKKNVILLHETYDCTVDTLEWMIETLIEKGYSFDTLDNY